MIRVTVDLVSAIHSSRSKQLARMHICNIGGSNARGDYSVEVFRGRDEAALAKGVVQRRGRVLDYPRLAIHVWHLIAEALDVAGYSNRGKPKEASVDQKS